MKLVHLSDLHIGKRVNEFNLLEDQAYILDEILAVIDRESPDAVIIAGDIYDKSVPSAEAVRLFDDFLYRLSRRGKAVFIISGNHDSPERIAFASRLISGSGIHLSPVYKGKVEPVVLGDEYGPVSFYMLPFVKPAHVRAAFPEEEIGSYTEALGLVVEKLGMDKSGRNVLIAHQFVTGAARSDSEGVSVGGLDNVDAAVFDGIDYVALGHIHRAQSCTAPHIRYCGTPLKYSFSECSHEKSVSVVELMEKGSVNIRTVPLSPLRDMREIRGSYMELCAKENYAGSNTDDYLHITLTDEEDIPDVIAKLRSIYPNIMKLDYDNKRTRSRFGSLSAADAQHKSPLELFGEFYEEQNGQAMSSEQEAFARELMEKIWEGSI